MKEEDSRKEAPKTWQKTRVQNLLRHKSGRYYARLYEGGKEKWQSLKTDHFGVAQAKLSEILKGHKKRKALAGSTASAKMTVGDAMDLHLQRLELDSTAGAMKPNTLRYWRQTLEFLKTSWPDLEAMELRKVSAEDCRTWAAKTAPETSDTRFNNAASLLRSIFTVGAVSGVIYTNPAEAVKRVKVKKKEITLPSKEQFQAILEVMKARSRGGYHLAAGLAYTGMRIEEAANLAWKDVNFETQEITVKGHAETGTKNSEIRQVPMTPKALELFREMSTKREGDNGAQKVFEARSCIKSLQRACVIVEAASISHHDLRHYFATACIESGVDVPTVSRWLGHKDGGALAMRTYGHLRREHSLAAAAKVVF